ncbi:MAG TPA: Na/Pi cotransporter family protein [Bacteroidetes bacterium]|nr:Na/Pi cotransporter family protein [Bacteroidota bacterium]
MPTELSSNNTNKGTIAERIFQVVFLAAVIYFFLVSLEMMGASFKLFGKDFAKNLVQTASNPMVGLFIGMLATAIVQSSSTTTSTVVVLVASGAFGPASDPATISLAVPIIMGANIGTSVTSTIVALGHITNRKEYRKAIAAATVHDFFNIITVSILFPLEYFFGILSRPASALAEVLYVGGGDGGVISAFKVVKHAVKPASEMLLDGTAALLGAGSAVIPFAALGLALLLLFFSLRGLTSSLKKLLIGRLQEKVDRVLFGNPVKAILWGAGLTAFVQSSSVTSSLTVPLVATNKVSLRKAFPFLMGANIGTTTTALIAALLTVGENPVAGLAIALCHVFFNLAGVLLIFPIPQIRSIPIKLARKLGNATMRNRLYGIGYIAVTFFLVPFLLILITGSASPSTPDTASINSKEIHSMGELENQTIEMVDQGL